MTERSLTQCVDRALIAAKQPQSARSRLAWAQMFWQVYTEGDLRLAPAPLGIPLRGAPADYEAPLRRPDVQDMLQRIRWVLEHSLAIDDDGPLRWVPP